MQSWHWLKWRAGWFRSDYTAGQLRPGQVYQLRNGGIIFLWLAWAWAWAYCGVHSGLVECRLGHSRLIYFSCNLTRKLTLYFYQGWGGISTCHLLHGLSLVLFPTDGEPQPGEPDSLLFFVIHHWAPSLTPTSAVVKESHFPELPRFVDRLVPVLLDGVLGVGEAPPPG